MDKKSQILFGTIFTLIVICAVAIYYRDMIIQDYPVINVPTP
jgi:hypothetical protein